MDENVLRASLLLAQLKDSNKKRPDLVEAFVFLETLIISLSVEAGKAQELENKLLALSWSSGVR